MLINVCYVFILWEMYIGENTKYSQSFGVILCKMLKSDVLQIIQYALILLNQPYREML